MLWPYMITGKNGTVFSGVAGPSFKQRMKNSGKDECRELKAPYPHGLSSPFNQKDDGHGCDDEA
ncbi:hypothetical protein AGR6A_Lc90350 [Agrobacterium sp. NCPPB 925]|nr:hypothetical protein AGR6A_Lc90350 [Agrobacterium sp. NCPPB 925]